MADQKPASSTPDDAAMKARIISHMNNDHGSSLSYYLQHYSSLPVSIANTAKLTDISLSRLTLSTSRDETIYLPIRPSAMESLSEARARLVYMSNECMAALDLSPHIVTEYTPPGVFGAVIISSVFFGLWAFTSESHFAEGSFIRSYILRPVPQLADLFAAHHIAGLIAIIAIHSLEGVHFHRSRLRKHQVKMYSNLWWLWVLTCTLEGFGSFLRFDRVIRGLEEKAKAKKH